MAERTQPAHRVVVTGIGVVTPIGLNLREFWEGCLEGRSGAGPITLMDASAYDCRIAAEVKGFDPSAFMDPKTVRRSDRFTQFGIAATEMARQDAGLTIDESNAERIGVMIGSGIGGIGKLEAEYDVLMEKGPSRVSPLLVPMMIPDMGSGMVSIQLGAKGPNSCVVTACSTGTNAIGDAYHIIRRGDADAMFAGGTEAPITKTGLGGFCAAKAVTFRNDDPQHASRPFDKERDGFLMAEGAGVLVLERLEFAKARGARIYAEIVGYGMTGDAFHITQPDPEGDGAYRAMRMALDTAGLPPESVDYINAHGTSTPLNDKLETLAIKRAFGDHARKLAISSTKSMVGHLLGAAGAVEAAACLMAIQTNTLPPTINYEVPDPECDLDYVPNTARDARVNVVLSNSFGFGGHNATILFKRFTD
ncbi:MAG: 3-oxoacyl-[acyl-carrier-protein] synthase 2 [Fimbriimonadales bacterium]